MALFAWAVIFSLGVASTELEPDDVVVFFPTYAHFDRQAQVWEIPVHAWVYRPLGDSAKKTVALALFRRIMGIDKELAESEIFRQRASIFLVDNLGGKPIAIRLGEKVYHVGTTGANGHVQATLQLTEPEATALVGPPGTRPRWLSFESIPTKPELPTFRGAAELVSDVGLSIISDFDDTLRISEATDRKVMLRNTFSREFEVVPGMADVYRRWADAGAAFHYVSNTPWQMFGPMHDFCREQQFAAGSFHMKHFRLKDKSTLDLLASPEKFKLGAIEPILAAYPGRTFILVGDSGAKDPEIYGTLAREFPHRIARIYVRNVTGETHDSPRLQAAFRDVPGDKWLLFSNAQELVLPPSVPPPAGK
jgi:phosphatidate phosphatase APP1